MLDVGNEEVGDFVLGQGATKYVGVDIDETIAFSWCAEKRALFGTIHSRSLNAQKTTHRR